MSFEKGNPPCRKRTTVGNRSGVILPPRASPTAVRTSTGRTVVTVAKTGMIVAVAAGNDGGTIPDGPNVGGAVRGPNPSPMTGAANGDRALPVRVTGVVSAVTVPPRVASRGAETTKDGPEIGGIRPARSAPGAIGAVSRTAVTREPVGPDGARIGRDVVTAEAGTADHVVTAARADHGAGETGKRIGRGGKPATGTTTAVRVGVHRSVVSERNVTDNRGVAEVKEAVVVSIVGRRAPMNRICRTRSRQVISTPRFAGICSAWTRTTPKPSPAIW